MFEWLGTIRRSFQHLGGANRIAPTIPESEEIDTRHELIKKFPYHKRVQNHLEKTQKQITFSEKFVNDLNYYNNSKIVLDGISDLYEEKEDCEMILNEFYKELRYNNLEEEFKKAGNFF